MVATFMDNICEPTFFADIPGLYWMPFHERQLPLPRITRTPSPPSTYCLRSVGDSAMVALLSGQPGDRLPVVNVVRPILCVVPHRGLRDSERVINRRGQVLRRLRF